MAFLSELKTRIKAQFVRFFRTREIVRVFKAGHATELTQTPVQMWPMVKARQSQEIALIKAGKLQITDRKSWGWPFMPQSVYRMSTPVSKTLPYNLRRMSRTPVPRRAMNIIKDAITNLDWEIRPIDGEIVDDETEQAERIKIGTKLFIRPNNEDSFQTWAEKGIEDFLLVGGFVSEMRLTPDPMRPIKMWAVNVDSVRIFISWREDTPDMPRYAQMTGLRGERGAILFYDDELMYIKDNESTDNPFGLGKMEIAFESVNSFLAIQRMAGMAGADQIHKTWMWWEQPQTDQAYQILRRHIQNELEGQAKVSIIGGVKKPEVVEIKPVSIEDLLIPWQEMLIRMIANAFGMSAMALNITNDVNRAVGQVLDDKDFRTAVVPMAKRMQGAFTRQVLHRKLGWTDLEFVFVGIDDPDLETQMDMCARMYSTNAITPNQIRKKMGEAPMQSPYAEMTQMEAMIIMAQITGMVQDQNASNAFGRQVSMMQMQPPPDQEEQDNDKSEPQAAKGKKKKGNSSQGPENDGGGGAQQGPPKPPNFGTGKPGTGTVKLPKTSMTQFPVSGSGFTAADIAQMPVDELSGRIQAGQLPKARRLLRDMKAQAPGILEQMSEEVRQFLEDLADEENQPEPKTPQEVVNRWRKEQGKRLLQQNSRTSNYSDWLYKTGGMSYRGKPVKNLGTPGKPPDVGI